LPETGRRNIRHGTGRFGNDGGDIAFSFEDVTHQSSAGQSAHIQSRATFGVGRIAVRATIAGKGRHMFGTA